MVVEIIKSSALFLIVALSTIVSPLQAKKKEADKKKNEFVFGQSGTFSGSLGLYGNIIKTGINLYFKRINANGGVRNKTFRLVSLHDGGNPKKTEANINSLRKQGITMFIGNMGTRSILKVLPLIKKRSISMLFPWSGNQKLRAPSLTNIVNGPGLLMPQIKKLVDHVKLNIREKKIAVFHADGNFSTNATNMLLDYLQERSLEPLVVSSYNRHTLKVTQAADKVLKADPKIVFCVGTSMPTVRFINRFFEKGHYATKFFGIDSTLFVPDIIGDKGVQFGYSSAVPSPRAKGLKLGAQYLDDMKRYYPDEVPNALSFSYYISTAIVIEAMMKIKGPITQQAIIDEIENMQGYDLHGFTVTFNHENRHAFGNNVSIIKG